MLTHVPYLEADCIAEDFSDLKTCSSISSVFYLNIRRDSLSYEYELRVNIVKIILTYTQSNICHMRVSNDLSQGVNSE